MWVGSGEIYYAPSRIVYTTFKWWKWKTIYSLYGWLYASANQALNVGINAMVILSYINGDANNYRLTFCDISLTSSKYQNIPSGRVSSFGFKYCYFSSCILLLKSKMSCTERKFDFERGLTHFVAATTFVKWRKLLFIEKKKKHRQCSVKLCT